MTMKDPLFGSMEASPEKDVGVTFGGDHSEYEVDEEEDGYLSADASSDNYNPMDPGNKEEPDKRAQVEQYSAEENKDVWTWKSLVIMLLVVAGGFSAAVCASFVKDVQDDQFKTAHYHAATSLSHGLQKQYTNLVQNMETQAQWIVAQAQDKSQNGNVDWPNVTLSTFHVAAQSLTAIPGVETVAWAPLVSFLFTSNQDTTTAPIRETSPVDDPSIGDDVLANDETNGLFKAATTSNETLLTGKQQERNQDGSFLPPKATIMTSIKDNTQTVVGLLLADLEWVHLLGGFLPDQDVNQNDEPAPELHVVVRSSCQDKMDTFLVTSNQVEYVGPGDLHQETYDEHRVFVPFYHFKTSDTPYVPGHCFFSMHIFPTQNLQDEFEDNLPMQITVAVTALFVAVTMAFMVYDYFVTKRQSKIVTAAARSHAIVASVFPAAVRERLMEDASIHSANKQSSKGRLKNLMNNGLELDDHEGNLIRSKPIADLFPEATIFFADIQGFTAWSSTREPSHVFTLLETIFAKFDAVAKKRRIFKVETVGDCYVAATGLPDPRPEHAVAMARFARDCLRCMREAVNKLELSLGPDTADLQLRIGIHSGPITAGVLRGDKSRFQLFGDTMNTASRMESTGMPGRVQISQATAEQLAKSGKSTWYTPREEKVLAKGKGHLSTYWLKVVSSSSSSGSASSSEYGGTGESASGELMLESPKEKSDVVILWVVDIMKKLLIDIEVRRLSRRRPSVTGEPSSPLITTDERETGGTTVLDEVVEIIRMPKYTGGNSVDKSTIVLSKKVTKQLEQYVRAIASMYNHNAFHSFEHAMHVTNSAMKLLSRIVSPDIEIDEDVATDQCLHDHTYGITSDPLTQFACVFSALIHDVDHQGVPNSRLVEEIPMLATLYNNRSVAEQNSVDLSWNLLQDSNFVDLQNAIYCTPEEKLRFRQLVVNGVMATDIADKDLKARRNKRWEMAFNRTEQVENESAKDSTDRKATIVIEHLIQASDIAHTMQHWHIYRKWNERLFVEMLTAYRAGRSSADPATFWYEGELGFFDFYIIPLAQKLKECGVFGVSSDEYWTYAKHNRAEWQARGKEVVAEMVQKYSVSP